MERCSRSFKAHISLANRPDLSLGHVRRTCTGRIELLLDPGNRTLYTEALRPPVGYVFDQGLAGTFSLDLTTLLSIPLNLALFSGENPKSLLSDSVVLMEALRRTASGLSIYCQQGQIRVPESHHVLYSYLE